jgi:predicted transcriptional regulator
MPSERARREHLLDGRRVRIMDLIVAGHLKPGDDLYYHQRIGEAPHEATVTERGRLRLHDGREFNTPSAAGAAVAGLRAVPGWSVWRRGLDGPTLHQLRQQLLKSVADEVVSDSEVPTQKDDLVRRRFAFLEDAHAKAAAGEPKTVTVRELITLWDLTDRDRATSAQIDADLANHDLTTAPDFRAVGLDSAVRLLEVPEPAEAAPAVAPAQAEAEAAAGADEESIDIGLTLGNLLSGDWSLAWVTPTASFEEVITKLQINDYSQVAVLANQYTLHGAISWKSIAEAKHLNPAAAVSDAIDRTAKVFDYDSRLLDVLPTLQADEFIFVRDFERRVSGIVTAADVVRKYDDTATPFFLIGEVDQELRQLIMNSFEEDTVRQACKSAGTSFKSFETMTIGQYQAVLGDPMCWQQLGWPLDRAQFVERLSEIRRVRNNVMHFNPDPPRPIDVEKLRIFLRLIRRYGVQ